MTKRTHPSCCGRPLQPNQFRFGLSLAWCLIFCLFAMHSHAQPSVANEQQARALLAQMTLDEKIGQMVQVDMNALKDKADLAKLGIGSMLSGGDSDPADITPKGWLQACAEYQSLALKSRLRIPILYGIDAVHGHNNVDGAVIFPHNIGLGATRNRALVQKEI